MINIPCEEVKVESGIFNKCSGIGEMGCCTDPMISRYNYYHLRPNGIPSSN